jgi:uncharacterized protein YndB with AHSA1/START domain
MDRKRTDRNHPDRKPPDRNHHRFRSLWTLPAPAPAVYRALERIEDYPCWWPQIREVTRRDDTSGTVRIRALLPYDLVLTLREERRDCAAGVLGVLITGDLEGWARWTITPAGSGTRAVYDQEVDVRKPLLRRLAVPGRPLLRANHALMMRAGRRGLAARLEAV